MMYLRKMWKWSCPSNINHCCYECGDPLDGIFCKQCTCKSCGKDAHIGYNCPSKVPVISIPEPRNNQTIDELPQALPIVHPTFHSEAESPFTLDSTPTYVDESPNVFNPPPQPSIQTPQYTVNHPIFNAHNDLLNSQNKLMEQMTSICEMVDQLIQKKQEEKQIQEDQAANARYWKIPAYYDDDDDYNFPIIPNVTVDSLSMGDKHLDTVPATESDEFIKSSV
nr:hypothetical protein [Tanacetum cinerariifolium]